MSNARMYMADQRGIAQDDTQRILSTFNYQHYYNIQKKEIESLYLLNECSLAVNKQFIGSLDAHSVHLFIPVVGDLLFEVPNERQSVFIGEVLFYHHTILTEFTIKSIQPNEKLTFIHLALRLHPVEQHMHTKILKRPIPLGLSHGTWIQPLNAKDSPYFDFAIGSFHPENEFNFMMQNKFNNLFIYTIEGAVEVEDMLIYAGDGVYLPATEMVCLEALCPHSILFVLSF